MLQQKRLAELWGEIRDLQSAEELLDWDQETQMPEGGQENRGRVQATLAGIKHAKLTSPELEDCLAACADAAEPGSVLESQVREAQRQTERAMKMTQELAKALAEASSAGLAAWQQARKAQDFGLFETQLRRLVQLKREEAAALAQPSRSVAETGEPTAGAEATEPYDALLDVYEPGMTVETIEPLFSELSRQLAPLVQAVADSGVVVDESPALGTFPLEQQVAFGRWVLETIGFDFQRGRMDPSAHPFCIGLSRDDVRFTWWSCEEDFRPNFFAFLHEGGHALYEQGLPAEWERTPLGAAVSLGIHESQSRLWENQVGRSRGFWRGVLPRFRDAYPHCHEVTVEDLWPAFHTVGPSLIRVEADEVTYNLHIVARFELERALISDNLQVGDLVGAWDDTYQKLLGLRPGNVAQGVLQDIHWSMGLFGYFPTYTLGTLLAAQLFAAAQDELGDLDGAFAAGDFASLREWLRAKIHRHGCRHLPADLIEKATGSPLSAEAFVDHVKKNTRELYSIS